MAFKFPTTAEQGLLVTLPSGRKYIFNEGKYDLHLVTIPVTIPLNLTPVAPIQSETEPVLPNSNPLWFKPSTSELFCQYNNGEVTEWVAVGGSSSSAPIESESAPPLPNENMFWFKPSTQAYHYQYNDGDSVQWVEL